jgi:hypothetical protein
LPAHRAAARRRGRPEPEGSLGGVVRTSDGLPLPGVAVVVQGRPRAPRDDRPRRLVPHALAPGSYTLRVDAPGLTLAEPRSVRSARARRARTWCCRQRRSGARRRERDARRGDAVLARRHADVLDRERIDDRAAPSLCRCCRTCPASPPRAPARRGSRASVFVRGGESRFARVLIDGVAVNQPGGAYDFGSALPFELERVEVVRGAASSLYGGDALAGVVSLETRRARAGERPSLRAEGEGGSFDWQRYFGATSGAHGDLDWNAGVQRLTTDNEAPNSRFEDTGRGALRRRAARPAHRPQARGPLRDEHRGTPGPTAYGRPDLDASSTVTTSCSRPRCAAAARRSRSSSASATPHRPALEEPRRLGLLRAGVGRGRRAPIRTATSRIPRASRTRPTGWSARTRPISRPDRVTC